MKYIHFLFSLIVLFRLMSCEKIDANDAIVVLNTEEKTFYINTQEDFNQYSNHEFPAGSSVLFAVGKVFKGQFIIKGKGTTDNPNIVTAYDPKTGSVLKDWIDNKPVIEGEGKVNSPILLKDGGNWEINNLEVTNTNGSKENQGDILGIHVIAENVGTIENIVIRNCHVHHVNGDVGGKKTGGIQVHVLGDRVKTKFHNLLIENNYVEYCGGVGISNQSSWGNIDTETYYPWTDFVIRGNRVKHTGRNGIIVRYATNPLVEYNILAYNSMFDTGHSIFNFNTVNCIVQYNEAYGNTSDNPDDIDHGGFDADYNSRATIIQYNYSHDNHWFCGIMRKGINTDVTIRYNISQNEEQGALLYGFPNMSDVKDVKIYNNTFYFGKGKGNKVFVRAGKERVPIETTFRNNIFYFEDKAEWGFEPDETCLLENNLFYNVSPKGKNAIEGDPLFVNPGSGGTDIDMTDPNRLSGYKLKDGSTAIGAGKVIENNGGEDFCGNSVSEVPNIGAFQNSKGKRYLDIVFDSVIVEKDVVFGETINHSGSQEELLLDIYQPAGDNVSNRPVIVWIHGGGFRYGNDKSQRYIVIMAERFAKRGYVCLSINYRLREDPKADKEGTIKDALEDAQKSLDWLRANHEKLNVDLSRIIIGGGSAGGILASNLCYKEDSKSNAKEGIIGLVNLWGSPDQSYTFFEVDKNDPPTIIVHGTADELVSFENSKLLIEKLEHNGIRYELVAIEGAGHTPARHMNDFNLNISRFLFNLVKKE